MTFVYELPTGYGKTKLALDKVKELNLTKVLIVIPRLVLIDNWKAEIEKWSIKIDASFSTYVSLHKQKLSDYQCTIFDECHHISDRCAFFLKDNTSPTTILLSATINREMTYKIRSLFNVTKWEKKTLSNAIADNKLPKPKIIGIPLELSSSIIDTYYMGKKSKTILNANSLNHAFALQRTNPTSTIAVRLSQKDYMKKMDKDIEYWKLKAYNNEFFATKWLRLCGERLFKLADWKLSYTKDLLNQYKDNRIIVFCNNIEQSNQLNIPCINSKNTVSPKTLREFQEEKINAIATVNMLNEGCNLNNCQIAIFNSLNASNVMVVQKIGRLLRHPKPIIIIPYFVGTREEELFNKIKNIVNGEN